MIEIEGSIEIKLGSERSFGLVMAAVFMGVGLYPLINGSAANLLLIITGVLFSMLALARPQWLEKPNLYWHKLGLMLGAVVSPIVLFFVYVIAIVPIGILFKFLQRDMLREKLDEDAESYWILRDNPPESMDRQF